MTPGPVTPRATAPRGAADRVRRSHAQTRTTLRLALAFIAAAPAAWAVEGTRWLPLHLFLAGGVVLAISGVSLMLTVTWSAAPAPADRWVLAQRGCIAAGAVGVGMGRESGWPDAILGLAGALYVIGLVLLAGLLVVTVRRGVERRFDVAVVAYVLAVVAGLVGGSIGVAMGVGTPSPGGRAAHVTVNLLGLVGLVVGGTMPFFAATVGRSKMSPDASARRLALTVGWLSVTLLLAVGALAADADPAAALGLAGYAVGVVAVLTALPRPTRRQLDWAGPRLIALWSGGAWWAIAVMATAFDVTADRAAFGDRWLLVLVLAGYAQVLWGSLAYVLPMLRGGGHERLGEGFAATRSWPGLVAANLVGLSLALALPGAVTAVALVAWVLDGAWRAARVGTAPAARPDAAPPSAPLGRDTSRPSA